MDIWLIAVGGNIWMHCRHIVIVVWLSTSLRGLGLTCPKFDIKSYVSPNAMLCPPCYCTGQLSDCCCCCCCCCLSWAWTEETTELSDCCCCCCCCCCLSWAWTEETTELSDCCCCCCLSWAWTEETTELSDCCCCCCCCSCLSWAWTEETMRQRGS